MGVSIIILSPRSSKLAFLHVHMRLDEGMARDEVQRSTGGADSTRTSPLERCFLQNPAFFSVDCRGVSVQDMTGECLLRDEKKGDDCADSVMWFLLCCEPFLFRSSASGLQSRSIHTSIVGEDSAEVMLIKVCWLVRSTSVYELPPWWNVVSCAVK